MKKLLGILSSLFPVASISSTVIACDGEEETTDEDDSHNEEGEGDGENNSDGEDNKSGEDNGGGETEEPVEELTRELFEQTLAEEGVDGSTLNNHSTFENALSLIEGKVKRINESVAEIKFVNVEDVETKLQVGNNMFTVAFDVNGNSEEFQVIVKDVQDGNHLDTHELETYINALLDDEGLFAAFAGSKLSKDEQIKKLTDQIAPKIKEKVADATVNITIANETDQNKEEITIEIDKLPDGHAKISKKLKFTEHAKKTTENNAYDNMISKILTEGIDASHLREGALFSVAATVLEAEAEKFDEDAEVDIKNPADENKKLVAGDNQIDVILKIGNDKPIEIKAKLKGVVKWSVLDQIASYYKVEFDLEDDKDIETYGEYVKLDQEVIDVDYPSSHIKVTLKDSHKKSTKFKLGLNKIDAVLTQKSEKRDVTIKVYYISTHTKKTKAKPSDFPKISKYLQNGIDAQKDFKVRFTTNNTVGQLGYEIWTFLESLQLDVRVYGDPEEVSTKSHLFLPKGEIKLKFTIVYGKKQSKFTITVKNIVVGQEQHQQHH